jgi:hypothetical protein
MRLQLSILLLCFSGLIVAGCAEQSAIKFVGPTVDTFSGKLVHDGKPVTFAEEGVIVQVMTPQGARFGIPIAADGSFQVGKMQTGQYSAILERTKKGAKGSTIPNMYNIPGGFKIEEGKSDYSIELGKGWKA